MAVLDVVLEVVIKAVKYIAVNLSVEEVCKIGLRGVLPWRRKRDERDWS